MSLVSRMIRILWAGTRRSWPPTSQAPSILRCEWMLASPTRMNRCLPRLSTSSTYSPVRSTVANFGTRTSQRVSVLPASASRSCGGAVDGVAFGHGSRSSSAKVPTAVRRSPDRARMAPRQPVRLAAMIHDRRLVAVLEVPPADTVQQWRCGEQHRRGRTLLDGLEPPPASWPRPRPWRSDMPLQRGRDPAGHQRVGDDAVVAQRRVASTANSTFAVLDWP